jgi:XTP/dITP diphosphohydrolase
MKKISQLLMGSNNKGKLKEIKALLPKRIKIYSTSDFNIKSPVENGKTFEG